MADTLARLQAQDRFGRSVMSVERRMGLRDAYRVTIADPPLDRRLAVAMTVALDALQDR